MLMHNFENVSTRVSGPSAYGYSADGHNWTLFRPGISFGSKIVEPLIITRYLSVITAESKVITSNLLAFSRNYKKLNYMDEPRSREIPYDCTLTFTDGSNLSVGGCGNRPKLAFQPGSDAVPIGLFSGVGRHPLTKPGGAAGEYTLFRPVLSAHSSSSAATAAATTSYTSLLKTDDTADTDVSAMLAAHDTHLAADGLSIGLVFHPPDTIGASNGYAVGFEAISASVFVGSSGRSYMSTDSGHVLRAEAGGPAPDFLGAAFFRDPAADDNSTRNLGFPLEGIASCKQPCGSPTGVNDSWYTCYTCVGMGGADDLISQVINNLTSSPLLRPPYSSTPLVGACALL
jgi:hypothetical protein